MEERGVYDENKLSILKKGVIGETIARNVEGGDFTRLVPPKRTEPKEGG